MTKISIIIGTTRQQRFGVQPAEWIKSLAEQQSDATFEVVDLKDVNLPLFDEPLPPAAGQPPENKQAQAWAKTVADSDGFIIVTGEYDHTIPASLSNAIQFLSKEWNAKPVGYVSYGVMGGVRAVEHLRSVAGQLNQYDISAAVEIPNYWGQLDENGAWTPSDKQIVAGQSLLSQIVFWAGTFKTARAKLS